MDQGILINNQSQKMRVLHIFNEIKFSGAEIMYENAAALFQSNGIELLAMSTGNEIGEFSNNFKSADIQVQHMKLPIRAYNPFFLYLYFRKIYILLKKENINLIHIHRSRHFLFFSFIGFLLKIPTIRTVHNVFKHRKWTWPKGYLERYVATNFFKVKFQTIGASVYQNELKYYKNESTIVNNWYNEDKFYPLISIDEKQKLRNSLNISKDATVIISTGGCSSIKNHHDIIRALQLVNEKSECYYLHLGKGKTENEEHELAKSLGVYDKILFLGNQQNVRDFLVTSDIYVMPSRFEGLSIAAIEAMACGLPSILYDVPGLRDLIESDDNGYLICESHKVLAEKILTLAKNPSLRDSKGKHAQQFVEKNFSVANGVNGILKLYKD